MKIYGKNIKEIDSKELEHRANYLKRNLKLTDSLGDVRISFKHHQEILVIEEELLRRGA